MPIWMHLRKSKIPVARRWSNKTFTKLPLRAGTPEEVDLYSREQILKEAGIPVYSSTMHGSSFSKLKPLRANFMLKSAVEGKAVEPLVPCLRHLNLSS